MRARIEWFGIAAKLRQQLQAFFAPGEVQVGEAGGGASARLVEQEASGGILNDV